MPDRYEPAVKFNVGRCHFGASVHHHYDGVGFFERDLRLAEDFCRDEVFVFGKNAARIHDARRAPAIPLRRRGGPG